MSGELARLAERFGLGLVVVFGSAARGEPAARDLDIAVGSRRGRLDAAAVVVALMDLTGTEAVDGYRRYVAQAATFAERPD